MLEIKNLKYSVHEDTHDGKPAVDMSIIDELNLKIDAGKLIVVTGPNGGGKSTLAQLIMGMRTPDNGQILFEGRDITGLNISERANLGIGYGFQQPARFKGMKIKKLLDIAAGKRLPMLSCNEYLAKVGLCSAEYLTREIDKSLSGGEVKRIEIATILARDPKLAIFDEPEAGIDLWSFDRLTQTFQQIHEENPDKTIIIISHQERIIELADEIIMLDKGEVAASGTPADILPKMGLMAKGMHGCKLTEPTKITGKINTSC